jgi:uncharacterized protein HemX
MIAAGHAMTLPKSTLQVSYQMLQVALLVAFVLAVALFHFRGRERADYEQKLRFAEQLLKEATEQQELADNLLARSQKTLAAAEAMQAVSEPSPAPPATPP